MVFLVSWGLGCARPEILPSQEENAATTLQSAEAILEIQKPLQVGALTLQLEQVEDSRCPLNALCVRYGAAVTQIQVQDTRGHRAQKRLYLGDALPAPDDRGFRPTDSVEVELGAKKYLLVLQEVQPYPNTADQKPPQKTAKVTVRPL